VRLSPAAALLWTLGVTGLLLVSVRLLESLRPGAASDVVSLTACEAAAYLLGCFGVLQLHAPEASARTALGLRPSHPAVPALGAALGLSLLLPTESLRQLSERFMPETEKELADRAALLSADGVPSAVVLIIGVACVAPLVEELFYRGALFGGLRRATSASSAALFSTLFFVFGHLNPKLWPQLLVVALVLGYLRAATGSLFGCIALHVAFNGATVAAHLTGVASVTRPLTLPWPVLLGGWVMTAALLFLVQYLARKSPEAEAARAEDADEP
jgi:membrane protease YdiL (CAAX protease family)